MIGIRRVKVELWDWFVDLLASLGENEQCSCSLLRNQREQGSWNVYFYCDSVSRRLLYTSIRKLQIRSLTVYYIDSL
jgi:hypothetical protein